MASGVVDNNDQRTEGAAVAGSPQVRQGARRIQMLNRRILARSWSSPPHFLGCLPSPFQHAYPAHLDSQRRSVPPRRANVCVRALASCFT